MAAEITINDVAFVPQVVEAWVSEDLRKKSAILNSSAVIVGFEGIPKNGYRVAVPVWGGLTGEAQDAGQCLVPRGMNSAVAYAQIQRAGEAISVNKLVNDIGGTDPLAQLTSKLATFWERQIQGDLVASITGSYQALQDSATQLSVTAGATNFASIASALALYGEYMQDEYTIVMHSQVYAKLLAAEATQFRPGADVNRFMTYAGMQVIIDNSVPVTGSGAGAVYTTYLIKSGSFVYGEQTLGNRALEADRDILCDDDLVTSRKTYIIHPNAASFTLDSLTKATRVQLANPANWAAGTTDVENYGVRVLRAPL